ncbi:c-type cytochrome [Sphingomonas sp. DT-204]|uniref:c-type cytochrome n=1 Tax=Sphingomonas sp. DT-204 TaxID=3396166 RepID=UPI003F1B670D
MRIVGLIVMALTLPLIGARALSQQAPAPAAAAVPPPGPGLDLINERCGFCHSTGQVFQKRRTEAEWAATVQGMADRGAEVSPEEIKVITAYLAKNYAAAPATPSAGAPDASSRQ